MRLDADMEFMTAVLLLAVRLGALLLFTPLFSVTTVPVKIRVFFVLALAFSLAASLDISAQIIPASLAELIVAAVRELFLGALLGFGVLAAFGAFLLGGKVIDVQMGLDIANVVSPATNTHEPLLGTLLNLTAVVTFFMLDGHHLLIRGVAYSLAQVPVGASLGALDAGAVVSQFGLMFVYGLMLVSPILIVLLLVDIAMAMVVRTMPQLNIFIVSLPLKIAVGLIVLVLSLNYLEGVFQAVFSSIFRYWERLLA